MDFDLLSSQTAKTATYKDLALPLLEQGFLPVPLENRSGFEKKPAVKYKNLHTTGLTTRQVKEWCKKFGDRQIATVVPKHLVCADWDAAIPGNIHLPVTTTTESRRGEHHWYKIEENYKTTKLVINGANYGDIKAPGSIVVVPASVINGHQYQWAQYRSPEEAGYAQAPEWVGKIGRERKSPHGCLREKYFSLKHPTVDFPIFTPATLTAFSAGLSVQAAIRSLLGIPATTEQGFHCVLPDHVDTHPSASLFQTDQGHWVYRDWHCKEKQWFSLAEVYASQLRGRVVRFDDGDDWSGWMKCLWHVRLLFDAGVFRSPLLVTPLPEDAPTSAKIVLDGFDLLRTCRNIMGDDGAMPFSRRFGMLWCGISPDTFDEGKRYLLTAKILTRVRSICVGGMDTGLYLPIHALRKEPL